MLRLAFFFWTLAFSVFAYAQDFEPIDGGPIHEAYITRVTGTYVLDGIPSPPPQAILERIPLNQVQGLTWLPGYWQWDAERNDFIWVGGVWRQPPPGHHWVPGEWKLLDQGAVWVRGFWSGKSANVAQHIALAPPDQPDEAPEAPPSKDYFWAPGYFEYEESTHSYSWLEGQWQPLDPNWILVPAHYVWRTEGWRLVPSFWDWPLEQRGVVYASLFIRPEERIGFEYLPWLVVDPWDCVQRLYLYYPDYGCFFHHHWHYHQDLWNSCNCTPPWWTWPKWWCYNWHQNWGLWWWYCHPGYPQPHWLSQQMATHIHPPTQQLLSKWNHYVKTPFLVTPHGVVKPSVYLRALSKVTKQSPATLLPVVPVKNLKLVQKDVVKQVVEPKQIFKPLGSHEDKAVLDKPMIEINNGITSGKRGIVPNTADLLPKTVNKGVVSPDQQHPVIRTQPQEKQIQKPVIRTPGQTQEKHPEHGQTQDERLKSRTVFKTPPLTVPKSEVHQQPQQQRNSGRSTHSPQRNEERRQSMLTARQNQNRPQPSPRPQQQQGIKKGQQQNRVGAPERCARVIR